MRRTLIAGNWKMYKTISEALELVNNLKRELVDQDTVDVVICPPYTALSEVSDILNGSNIGLGAQDLHWEEQGAFTGEISAAMLKDAGATFVIIGHSERRKYFFETDQSVNKKIIAAQSKNLTPIVCVGETLEEREENRTTQVVEKQLKQGLKNLNPESIEKLVIAYEPVWAIGTGRTATPGQAEEVHEFIRNWIKAEYSEELSSGLRILYGGSVKPSNIKELIGQPDIDGALVGGASLEKDSFAGIIRNVK
ncbi:MAG: triose-phosphate isomerase [Candidatus Omnitrophica bacterium]|nr:triose-phosphate isomerase [Candidatus Omnitrophota bacterium]MBU2044368.1 triose-phosphate isomerase [Candidatus Omnitrophota bacterium]MBU2266146.1 triose-phosphate isomerase [Candidatus Omnitrophota bacterium]